MIKIFQFKKEDNLKNILPKRKTKHLIKLNLTWKKTIGKDIVSIAYKAPQTKEEENLINRLLKKINSFKPILLKEDQTKEEFDY